MRDRYRVRHERFADRKVDRWTVYDYGEPPGSARPESIMSVAGGVGGTAEHLVRRFAEELEAERKKGNDEPE